MENLILFLEKAGTLVTYFFIFCILSRMIAPYLGFSYGKFYNFVYKYSESIFKNIRSKVNYKYREYVPFISLILLYFINYLLFTSYSYRGVLVSGSGLFYLLNLEFLAFLRLFLRVVLDLSGSLVNFFIFTFIVKIVLGLTNNKNSRMFYLITSITSFVTIRIRGFLYKINLASHEDIAAIGILIILKLMISSLYKLI